VVIFLVIGFKRANVVQFLNKQRKSLLQGMFFEVKVLLTKNPGQLRLKLKFTFAQTKNQKIPMKKKSFLQILFVVLVATSIGVLHSCSKKDDTTPVDPCANVSCLNGGTCSNGSCACTAGYEGTNCGTESRIKFLGRFTGGQNSYDDNCGTKDTTLSYSYADSVIVTRDSSSSDVSRIRIYNLGDYQGSIGNYYVYATVSGSNLTIPSQSQGGVTFSGTGSISGNTLTINYAGFVDATPCMKTAANATFLKKANL
jgi:hypothetical protein